MDEMVGKPLKQLRGYVFVLMPNHVKHIYIGERPSEGDATACGIRIRSHDPWAEQARVLKGTYCRECEAVARTTLGAGTSNG